MDELLQRLRRLSAEGNRPPNAASAALGHHLSQLWIDQLRTTATTTTKTTISTTSSSDTKILTALATTRGLNAAFSHEFFSNILSSFLQQLSSENSNNNKHNEHFEDLLSLQEWLPRWILRLDEVAFEEGKSVDGGVLESLWAGIRTLAFAFFRASAYNTTTTCNNNGQLLANTFRRLRIGRSCLLRNISQAACQLSLPNNLQSVSYQVAGDRAQRMLSPIMASCVLSSSTSSYSEKLMFLESFWRELRLLLQQQRHPNETFVASLLEWMTHVLLIYLWRLPHETAANSDLPINSGKELAYRWLQEIVDQAASMSSTTTTTTQTHLATTNKLIQYQVIPCLVAQLPHYRTPLAPILSQLTIMIHKQRDQQNVGSFSSAMDLAVALRLGAATLADPIAHDVVSALNLISSQTIGDTSRGTVRTLATVFLPNASCHVAASQLYQQSSLITKKSAVTDDSDTTTTALQTQWIHLGLFDQPFASGELLSIMAQSDPTKWKLSAVQQSAALLVGAAMMQGRRDQDGLILTYLKKLLTALPHLCITFLPILMDSLRRAADGADNNGDSVLYLLEILCDTVVVDPSCAQEVWNLLSADAPPIFRSTVIRLYPRLCACNRRLTRRVLDSLGPWVQKRADVELRVAVAATLSDLAKDDLLRDITDVVAWVQGFLADENPAVVHYAILTLHYLVLAQELDFDLVIKVLNKRLCTIGNADELLALPDIVLESLVLLLGDGECSAGSSSEDEDDKEPKVATVSPQVSRAVQSLVVILQSPKIKGVTSGETSNPTTLVIESIQRHAFEALGKYSSLALGVEEDGVKALVAQNQEGDPEVSNTLKEAGAKYSLLKDLVFQGIYSLPQSAYPSTNPALNLAARLVAFEEEVLGTTLWHTRGKRQTKATPGRKGEPSKTALAALPLESSVQDLYRQNPSSATATSSLLCFTGVSNMSTLLSLACEISNESADPFFRIFALQAWLHATSQLLTSVLESTEGAVVERLEQMVRDIRNWRNVMDQPDCMYLALACLAVHVPETWTAADKTVSLASVVADILSEITDGIGEGHGLESHDIAMMCLGLAGARHMQSHWIDQVDLAIAALESSTKTRRRSNFGAYYGLSIIAQSCPDAMRTTSSGDKSEEQKSAATDRMKRILAFLVEEFATVVDSDTKAFITFAACLRSGKSSPGLLQFPERGLLSLRSSHELKAKSLFIALGIGAPALASVDTSLLLGMHQMLQSIQRCHGRGLACAPTFVACKLASVLSQAEVELLHQEHVQLVEGGLSGNREHVTDALYEIAVIKSEPFPMSIVTELLQESSKGTVDVAILLVSAVLSLGSLPSLGAGTSNLFHHARLSAEIKKDSINRVKDLLQQYAQGQSGGRLLDFSSILLGLMASWKIQPSIASTKHAIVAPAESAISAKLRFAQLPTALPGSLLDAALSHVQVCYEAVYNVETPSSQRNGQLYQISCSLRCLESLSLPDQFATLFLDPLIHSKTDVSDLKIACTSLLLSQVSGRRRAAFDGREFLNLVLRLSSESYPSFRTIMESDTSVESFLRAVAQVAPKAPTDASEAALTNVLSLCLEHLKQDVNRTSWILTWLSSLQNLLQTAAGEKAKHKMSPRTINFLRRYTYQDVFNGLSTRILEPHCESVLQAYILCLEQLPLATLEEANMFSIRKYDDFTKQCFVVHCIAMLIQRDYMTAVEQQAPTRELTKAVAWYIQQVSSPSSSSSTTIVLQRLACSIADATQIVKPESKRELLLLILEGLLESKVHSRRVGLELLSILLARWQCPSSESDLSLTFLLFSSSNHMDEVRSLSEPTLSHVVAILVCNLPFSLASFCRQERIAPVVSNRLWRIYASLSEANVDPTTLDIVRKALVCCSDVNSGEEQFVMAVSSMLLED